MYKIKAYDSLEMLSEKQFLENIEIDIGFPFSSVIFDKGEFETACEAVALKFLGGFNDEESRTIFLNSVEIENSDLYIWENKLILKIFLEKHFEIIKEENNKFIIKLKNDEQLAYIRQIKLELID